MDYLYLGYYSNEMDKEGLDLFFEYQEAIKEDCKRIKYMINEETYSGTPTIGIMARNMSMACCIE